MSIGGTVSENAELVGEVLTGNSEAAVSIPRSALLSTAEGDFVYAVNGKNFFRTAVTVGVTNSEYVEIIEGLFRWRLRGRLPGDVTLDGRAASAARWKSLHLRTLKSCYPGCWKS